MTNLEGRVLRRRRARRPRVACATSWDPGGARHAGSVRRDLSDLDAARGLRRAASRLRGRHRRLLGHRPRAARRRARSHWPCPVGCTPARRVCSPTASATPTGARGSSRSPPRTHDGRRPARRADPGHRPAARALPERRADPSGCRARRRPTRSARDPASGRRRAVRDLGGRHRGAVERSRGHPREGAALGDVRPGDVFVPFHFAGNGTANLLTSDAVDPVSAMPEFKTGAVRVRRVGEANVA